MKHAARLCFICLRPFRRGGNLCARCAVDYDRHAHEDGTVLAAMIWAAKRARYYAHLSHLPGEKKQ